MLYRSNFWLLLVSAVLCCGCISQEVYTRTPRHSVLADGTTVDWRKDVRWRYSENDGWDLSLVAHVTRPDDGRVIVSAMQYLDVHEVEGLEGQPIAWNTPGGRDTRGKWWKGRTVDEPFKSRFEIKLRSIKEPVEAIDRLVLGGEWRVARQLRSFDIPASKLGAWLDVEAGLRVKGLVHRQPTHADTEDADSDAFHVTYDASVEYQDDDRQKGSTYITTHAVYDDASTGNAYMRGGTRAGGTATARYAFRGGNQGQRIAALRVYYAAGWESEPFLFTVTNLATPVDATGR